MDAGGERADVALPGVFGEKSELETKEIYQIRATIPKIKIRFKCGVICVSCRDP
jgi:hypothetical protein